MTRSENLCGALGYTFSPHLMRVGALRTSRAAACGTPTVASDSPGLRESVLDGETGLLVPHGDVPALADSIWRLISDDGLRGRMAVNARRFAESLSWGCCQRGRGTVSCLGGQREKRAVSVFQGFRLLGSSGRALLRPGNADLALVVSDRLPLARWLTGTYSRARGQFLCAACQG